MGLDKLQTRRGNRGGGQGFRDDGGNGGKAVCRFTAAFEDSGVSRLDGQGGDVCDYFRAGFKDDEENADGTCDARKGEIVVQEGLCGSLVD